MCSIILIDSFKNSQYFVNYISYKFISDYAFPYLSIIISMISNAAHFSMKLDQSMKSLFMSSITETKNSVILGKNSIEILSVNSFNVKLISFAFYFVVFFFLVGHWLILAYGILSLTANNLILLVLVPLPAIFYIFTVKFTDPSEFRDRDERNN